MDALVEQPELVVGIGIMAVLEQIPGEVFDNDGKLTALPAGSYRVDLLKTKDETWLAQFVPADKKTTFYLRAVEVLARGAPVEPQSSGPDVTSEVLLDQYLYSRCQRSHRDSTCNSSGTKWWREWCFTKYKGVWQFGWCDVIGY
jgi:hypothetical protein